MAAAALAILPALPAPAQTLADALVAAYESSNLLEQNRALLRAADEDVATAVAALRPVVNFVAQARAESVGFRQPGGVAVVPGPGGSPVFQSFPSRTVRNNDLSANLALTAEMTLYDFGRNQLGIQAAEASVLATRQALIQVEQQVLLNAVIAFADVRAALATVDVLEANVRLIGEQLQAARERFEVGEITRTDVALAEARLAAARSALAAGRGDLDLAREGFRAVTGAYPGRVTPPTRLPQLPATVDEAEAIARSRHPAVREAQFNVTVADINAGIAQRTRFGQVTAGASVAIDDSGGDRSSLSLNYAVPLYSGGARQSTERRAIALRDAARSGLHQTTVNVVEGVGRAWSNLRVAAASIEANRLQIEAATTALQGVQQEFELGARTTLDVLDAEQELLEARQLLIQSETRRLVAAYAVLSTMGLLTVEHLNLGIPTYDPEAYFNAVRNAPSRSPQGEALDRVLRRLQP